jgi:SAM-dependent methyltransferase
MMESEQFASIKARQRATWASGDFAVIGNTLQIVGETLCEAVDLRSNERALDVACGNGNATLAAARRWADVTGVDYVPSLLAKGRVRAEADGLAIEFVEGDAEALPFPDASFDVVLSTFGVMFAPNHARAAAELVRVCRPGGRIGLASWTAEGFIGELLRTVARFVPPPPGLASPALWGNRDHVRELFGAGVSAIETTKREFAFRYQSPAHFITVFRDFYGPTHKAFAALDEDGRMGLRGAIEALLARYDRGGGRGLVAMGEYLEVVATRR